MTPDSAPAPGSSASTDSLQDRILRVLAKFGPPEKGLSATVLRHILSGQPSATPSLRQVLDALEQCEKDGTAARVSLPDGVRWRTVGTPDSPAPPASERPVFVVAVGHDLSATDAERIQIAVAEALKHADCQIVAVRTGLQGYFGVYRDDKRTDVAGMPGTEDPHKNDLPGAIAAFAAAAADPACKYATLEYLRETKGSQP
jgi:hypothetical protein